MTRFFLVASALLFSHFASAQVISIAEARTLPEETEVTVSGTVTNGSELGIIRYLQDGTAGIAAYGPLVDPIQNGDSITITGVLKDYNGLLELDPIIDFTNHGPAEMPIEPEVISLSQIGENTEGELVKVENAIFADGGSFFTGNTEYAFSSGGDEGYIYIRNNHPLVGELVPIGAVNITGIASQFTFTGFGGYQLLPRTEADIVSPNPINIISAIDFSSQTNTGFELSWITDVASSTEAFFTNNIDASEIESNQLVLNNNTTQHSLSFTGLEPGEVYFVRLFSVAGQDTAMSNIMAFATVSETGSMTAFFNSSVDNSFANPPSNTALQTNLKDTIIAYLDRAQSTIDIAAYNINNSEIVAALNDAYDRGVEVRYIAEGQNANIGLGSLNPEINILQRENATGSGMHNKFIAIDYQDMDSSFVITGSTNFTNNNLFSDPNNLIIVQDKALTKSYRIEFNEMWGSTGLFPNSANSKFGENKINNTPKNFIVDGKPVELYFSPSDATTAGIAQSLESANASIEFALLILTQNMLADIIIEKSYNFFIDVKGVINDVNTSGSDFEEMVNEGVNVLEHTPEESLHHKYAIIDHSDFSSDPQVITGSHNWSSSAESVNDENTLIIHDERMANLFFQEFMARYNEVLLSTEVADISDLKIFPNPANDRVNLTLNSTSPVVELSIFDLNGRMVDQLHLKAFPGKNQYVLNISTLLNGVYLLQVSNGNAMSTEKLIIAR